MREFPQPVPGETEPTREFMLRNAGWWVDKNGDIYDLYEVNEKRLLYILSCLYNNGESYTDFEAFDSDLFEYSLSHGITGPDWWERRDFVLANKLTPYIIYRASVLGMIDVVKGILS